jgi:uncharacterized membrane protein
MNIIHKDIQKKAQATIEFTFVMVIVALLIFGLVKTLQWVGMDYAQQAHTRDKYPALNVTDDGDVILDDQPRSLRLNAFTRKF